MLAKSSIKLKKSWGKAVTKETSTIDKLIKFISEYTKIEHSLIKHWIENFCIIFKDITFEWADREKNRALQVIKTNKLRIDMVTRDVQCTNSAYRMSRVIDHKLIEFSIFHPSSTCITSHLKFEDVKTLNENTEYSVIVIKFTSNFKIEMQFGQHRVHLVKEFYPLETGHWWIVTLYDIGIFLNHFLLSVAISFYTKAFPQANDVVYAILKNEGDAWMHLVNLQKIFQDQTLNAKLVDQYKLQEWNFEAQLS